MAQTQTEELLEELDALKRRKGGASKEYEASLGTIKELRMRLVSAEEESGKLQRQLNALPAGDIPRHPAPELPRGCCQSCLSLTLARACQITPTA